MLHRVPNEHGGLHILSFFSASQFSPIFDHVHCPSIHFVFSSHGGSQISAFDASCCLRQTPVFFSHNAQFIVHGLSIYIIKLISIRVMNKYYLHLQIGGNEYHSDGTMQKARLAPIISWP